MAAGRTTGSSQKPMARMGSGLSAEWLAVSFILDGTLAKDLKVGELGETGAAFPGARTRRDMGLEESDLAGRVSKGEHGTEVRTESGLLTLM